MTSGLSIRADHRKHAAAPLEKRWPAVMAWTGLQCIQEYNLLVKTHLRSRATSSKDAVSSFVHVDFGAEGRSRHQQTRGRSSPRNATSSQSPVTYHLNPHQCDTSTVQTPREGLLLKIVRCVSSARIGHDALPGHINSSLPQCPLPRRAGLELREDEK